MLDRLYTWLHLRTYRRRLARQTRFADRRIISIGNLSAGGSGKTPVALYLAAALRNRSQVETSNGARIGAEAATPGLIVLRGYGGATGAGLLVGEDFAAQASVREAGDEAVLLARRSGLRVAAGRDRAELIRRLGRPGELTLLDDAFQNPSVYRDHELVLIDASVRLRHVRVFPFGKFREGFAALDRAHTVLLTRVDLARPEDLAGYRERIRALAPQAAAFESVHAPGDLQFALDDSTVVSRIDAAQEIPNGAPRQPRPGDDRRIGAFCGIGNPGAFFATLAARGFSLAERRTFADHHAFRPRDVEGLLARPADVWLTTEKDWMRLAELAHPAARRLAARLFTMPAEIRIVSPDAVDALHAGEVGRGAAGRASLAEDPEHAAAFAARVLESPKQAG